MQRLTEYHAGVAVIKNKALLPEAMAKLARVEDEEDQAVRIQLGEGIYLSVRITEQMKKDYKDCGNTAGIPGGAGKDCAQCSLDVDILGHAICELPAIAEQIKEET